jgi:hypothetical protein
LTSFAVGIPAESADTPIKRGFRRTWKQNLMVEEEENGDLELYVFEFILGGLDVS